MKKQGRKTFSVAMLLWRANYFLRNSGPEQHDERIATSTITSTILHDTDNYEGFQYLELTFDGTDHPNYGDQSRIQYFVSNTLRTEYDAIEAERAQK